MRNSTICATLAVAAVALTSFWAAAPTHADNSTWREGWCFEGEGISVVVDWHQAPAEAGTPEITDGSLTHIVRCVPLAEADGDIDSAEVLEFAGINHSKFLGIISTINGVTGEVPDSSWHIRPGSGTQWTSTYPAKWPENNSIAFIFWDYQTGSSEPYPVVNPAPIPTPEPTEEPTESPEPTQDPSTPGPGDGKTGTGTPSPTSTGTGTPPPTQDPTNDPVPSEQPTTPEPTTQEPTTQAPTTPPPPPTATPTPPSATPTTSVSVTPSSPTPSPGTTTPQPSATAHPSPDEGETAEPVWAAEPVTRVPAGAVGHDADAPWAGLVIGGAFTVVTAGGAVLVRRLRHVEAGNGRFWEEE